jgi:hypothetical protein
LRLMHDGKSFDEILPKFILGQELTENNLGK